MEGHSCRFHVGTCLGEVSGWRAAPQGSRQGPSRTALPELSLGAEPAKPALWSWNLHWSALPKGSYLHPLQQLTPRPACSEPHDPGTGLQVADRSEGLGRFREAQVVEQDKGVCQKPLSGFL